MDKQQQEMKEAAEKAHTTQKEAEYKTQTAYRGDCASMLAQEPARPSLRDRVEYDLTNARQASRRRDRMEELAHLLDKNPEIARILDLVEDLRG